jgi:hypothetical protein
MVYVLVGAIGAAAVIGGVRSMSNAPSPTAKPEPVAVAPAPDRAGAAAQPSEAAADSLSGEVLEKLEVPNYSYLRIGKKGSEGAWAAVPTAPIAVGAPARVVGAMKMTNFESKALKRTFPEIFFGTLAGASGGHGATAPAGNSPHGADGADPHASGADPHATAAAPKGNPHQGQEAPAGGAVEVKAVPKATGPDGRTILEIFAQRTQLAGKNVRVRATVVKATNGVMGKNYVHLRDGTGDAAAQTNDLTVTTQDTCTVGEVVMLEGVLATDIDIGSGYKFPTIIQDAKLVK